MKILHVIPKFPLTLNGTVIGGAANSLYNLAKSQSTENEVNITSFFPSFIPGQDSLSSNLVFNPIKMLSRPNSTQFGLEFITRLLLLTNKYKGNFDVLHGHSGHIDYIIPLTILSKLLKIPIVYSLSCPVTITSNITKFPGRRSLIASFAKDVNKFIAISNNVSESMRLVGIQKEQIAIIPPAVDITKFRYTQDTFRFRKKFNIKDNAPVFLFVGSVAPTKNLETVIFALRKVVDNLPSAVLIITTELNLSHYRERGTYLLKLIEEMHLQNNVIQMGIIDNMQEVMAAADMLIAPFRSTDGPSDYFLAALETMSVGRPVIVSSVGGMKEIVNDEIGLFVSPEDSDQLASAMLSLAENDRRRLRMGNNATSLIKAKFDPEVISEAVGMVYMEVMQNETRQY